MALGKLLGFIDRGGFDATVKTYSNWTNSGFNSILGGIVVKGGDVSGGLSWRELQTTAGSPPGSHALAAAGTAYIDAMFDQADAYNNTNPVLFGTTTPYLWTLLMRVFTGEWAPSWAQSLAGGPISVTGAANTGAWWTTGTNSYIAAYLAFMSVLAAYVPSYTVRSATSSGGLAVGANTQALAGHPLLGQLVVSPTNTKFAETMTKDDYNVGWNSWSPANSSLPTPYTAALDEAAIASTFSPMGTTWGTTPLSLSHNPYVEITATGDHKNETETETLMTSFAGGTWPYRVLANNSLRANGLVYPPPQGPGPYSDPHGTYTAMYTKMASFGQGQANADLGFTVPANPIPIEIQTSTYAGMGSTVAQLTATIKYGGWLGARAIELPNDSGGYTNMTLAQLAVLVPALLDNDPSGGGSSVVASSVRSWRTYRHR